MDEVMRLTSGTVRGFVETAMRLMRTVDRDLRLQQTPQAPEWRFYLHPRTHESLIVALRTETDTPLMYGASAPQMAAVHHMPGDTIWLLGLIVLADAAVDADGMELRYAVHRALPFPSESEYTGDKRSHP